MEGDFPLGAATQPVVIPNHHKLPLGVEPGAMSSWLWAGFSLDVYHSQHRAL